MRLGSGGLSTSPRRVRPTPFSVEELVNIRQETALALMCAEWDSTLTHLRVLREVGCRVSDEVMERVSSEATDYAALWSAHNGQWWTGEESVQHARTWLIDHQDVMEDLLRDQGDGKEG